MERAIEKRWAMFVHLGNGAIYLHKVWTKGDSKTGVRAKKVAKDRMQKTRLQHTVRLIDYDPYGEQSTNEVQKDEENN